jgi:hypothetical protein
MKTFGSLLGTLVLGFALCSHAQAEGPQRPTVNVAGLKAANKASSEPLFIAVPSATHSAGDDSLYRPGYELAVLKKACSMIKVRCIPKSVDEDPRSSPLMTLTGAPSGVDAILWGSDVRVNPRATDQGLLDAIGSLAETGDLANTKRKFMKLDRAWPQVIAVGVDSDTSDQAKKLCDAIHAKCKFTLSKNFQSLTQKFDAGQLQWVAHSQSWLFQNKDLEDRLTTAMEDLESKSQ